MSSLAVFAFIIHTVCKCKALENEWYPVFGTESSFQLNLDEDITYGASVPSVAALEENIFAVTWAATPKTRNIDYNENIYCRLFYMNDRREEPQLLLPTITINTFGNKSYHSPRISALSDHNNQISESKRFAIVWHSDDMNGDFDGLYAKIIRWDYEEENRNEISVIILSDNEETPEFKVNDATTHSIVGDVSITPIFDIGRFAITWLSWNRNGHMETYDVRSRVYDNYGSKSSAEFVVDIPSSKRESQPSITPLYISSTHQSTYLMATWSVYDDISDVSAIYSKVIHVGNDLEDIAQYVINETVMDGGIDVFKWNPSDGVYADNYRNEAPDTSYLMQDYMIGVWSTTRASTTEIHAAIYYVDIVNAALLNVYDGYTVDDVVHGADDDVNYRNPKVDTVTCYQSDLDYADFKNIDGGDTIDTCDVSICYQYDERNGLSKTYCSFWSIFKHGNGVYNITMHKYYDDDVEMTQVRNHTLYPESTSWNRFYEDISSPVNAKLLVVEQITAEDKGYGIYGRIMEYANWSMEHPPNHELSQSIYEAKKGTQSLMLIILLVVVFLVFFMGVFYACYYNKCVNAPRSGMKKDIMNVNKKVFQEKTEMIVKKWSSYKSKLSIRHKKHQEVSGIDTDDEDTDDIELGNEDDVTAHNRARRKKGKFKLSGDSDNTNSSLSDEVEIGGSSRMDLHNDSSSEQHQGNNVHIEQMNMEHEEIENSRVVLLKNEDCDVLKANLSSDESS